MTDPGPDYCWACDPPQPTPLVVPPTEGAPVKVKNINPVGAVDVPLLGREVGAGEALTVTDEQAVSLLAVEGNWAPADKAAEALLTKMKGA